MMRDIPMFPTEYGIASLMLKEVPYKAEAYIRIRDVQPGAERKLLEESAAFCRAAGAERIYAADVEESGYPLYAAILKMSGTSIVEKDKVENLFPVTEKTAKDWRGIWNERSRHVDCAATLDSSDEKDILGSNGAYFIHHQGELLGIGWVKDRELLAVAAVKAGAGERVMHTLLSLMEGESIALEVASTNLRAIRFYEKLGFVPVAEGTKWYRVL